MKFLLFYTCRRIVLVVDMFTKFLTIRQEIYWIFIFSSELWKWRSKENPLCHKFVSSRWRFLQYVGQYNQYKQRVLMHGHQGWNVRHGLCHIYMIYGYIWVVYSFCLFCCLFIIVTTQFVALYKPCKPKPKPSTFDNIVLTIYPQYWYWKTHKDIL